MESINRIRWNDLYSRSHVEGRPAAEIDSVPTMVAWGDPIWSESFPGDWLPAPGSWILDAGCGNGKVLASLVKSRPFNAVGFDIADEGLQIARRRIAQAGLDDRIQIFQQSFHEPWRLNRTFDFVYSLYAMQFALHSQIAPMMGQVARFLKPGGYFCCKIRGTSRSIPSNYTLVPGERNTYLSQEPHEYGMAYHHYDEQDIHLMVQALGGHLEHMEEVKEYRSYDAAPDRAWWQVVMRR